MSAMEALARLIDGDQSVAIHVHFDGQRIVGYPDDDTNDEHQQQQQQSQPQQPSSSSSSQLIAPAAATHSVSSSSSSSSSSSFASDSDDESASSVHQSEMAESANGGGWAAAASSSSSSSSPSLLPPSPLHDVVSDMDDVHSLAWMEKSSRLRIGTSDQRAQSNPVATDDEFEEWMKEEDTPIRRPQ